MDEPVRILWNAVSTFEASSADVSMNDSPFSAVCGIKSDISIQEA